MAGDDSLNGFAGNDYLDGGAGGDILAGGVGDDVYVVDSQADEVREYAGEGDDRIYAIRRGSIRAEWPAPVGDEAMEALKETARPVLTRRERHTTTVSPEQVNEVLLVARWFRIKPAELERTIRL